MPRITQLQIRNFRGLRDLSIQIPPAGAVVKGGNAKGKSSVLKAISAALAAQGVGPDAIRLGADAAEILVDLDAVRVRRSITAKGSSLSVTNADGDEWRKPQTRLTELLGTCALDALSFFLAEPKDRRRLVLEALPVKVEVEDVERWTEGIDGELDVDLEAHGLEVLEQLRKAVYARRTDANKQAKAARDVADAARPSGPPIDDALPLEQARAERDAAERTLQELRGREAAAEAALERTGSTRSRIAELRRQAEGALRSMPPTPTDQQLQSAIQRDGETARRVADLAAQLEAAQKDRADARDELVRAHEALNRAGAQRREIDALKRQADELEATLDAAAPPAITPEELQAAVQGVADAKVNLGIAEDAEDARVAGVAHAKLEAIAGAAAVTANALDNVVRRLTEVAPFELAKRSAVIPGLSLAGDTITLDGVAIDSLSGAEQMRFAVELCRRLNAKAKILICDGLERLDPEGLETFVKMATSDGWQLLGTKVDRGELVVEALEP